MAGRGRNDVVTIIYPPGCREISEDLGNDELIRRLKQIAHTFQGFGQAEDDAKYTEYSPLALHLAEDHYLNHQSRDVQLLVACCVADILRIFAPEAPYKDPQQIKTIFYFLIKQLGGLKDPKDPAFKRYFYLLENLAYVKSFNMCFDLEDFNEIFCALFGLMFKIVNDEHSGKVKTFMLDVLCPLITEADYVSNELLDIILINIVDPYKTQRKNAFALAKELVYKTSDTLEPYLQQFFNQVLILGKAEAELAITRKVYDLIYELYNISPGILLSVLPQLEFKLKSTEESERMGSVSLLARMFSEKGSSLADSHKPLWSAFLGRYNDISVAIRIKCVQYTMHFLINHPELQENIVDTLKARQHDSEENVRYEVVMAIVATAKKNFDIVAKSEQLLNFVKERTLDKKFKIRKEAMSGLAYIYRKYLSDPNSTHEATKDAIKWIKDKILHGYYMSGIEDRLLVERLLNMYLVPFNLESSERMKKLFMLFATVDENAGKAFIEIQKHQLHVRRAVSDLLQLYRNPKADRQDKEIQIKVHGLSKLLPEPMKAQEFLKKLSVQLGTDTSLLHNFEKVVDPDITCKDCQLYVNQILKKLGSPIMTNLYYGTVKQILERVSSVMIDREAIKDLVKFVTEALNNGDILQELGLDPGIAGERGLRLLYVLSYIFPSHFLHQDIIKDLIAMLSLDGEYIAPLVLSTLTYVGRKAPLESTHPEVLEQLIPIAKTFIKNGTPKQAKQAVKCLHMNTTESQDNTFIEILEIVKENLNGPRNDAYLTAIVALGHIAYLMPEKYPVQIKNVVARNIVKQLLMKEVTESSISEEPWAEMEEIALDTRCKVEAMKMVARWLIGLKDDTISAGKTFRMLNAHLTSKGDLHESGKLSTAECSWLRLAAGCAMLKICEQKGVGDVYTVDQFYNLSQLALDEVKQVRELFVAKLHKGLAKGVPFKCLPLDFMGVYALCGLESDKKLKEMAKRNLLLDIAKRRDCIKALSFTGGENVDQLPNIMPDYMLCFAVVILTHIPTYETNKDVQVLEQLKNALWFVLEPLMVKNENFSLQFYKMLLEMMKSHVVASDPPSDVLNHKMWALCDLSLTIIMSKATSYNDFNKEYPFRPTVPPLYYKPHPEGTNFENQVTYIPAEMALLPKTKIGMPVGWQTKRGRGKSTEENKNAPDSIDATASNEENGNHSQGVTSSRKRGSQDSTETSCISNSLDNGSNAENHSKSSVNKKISSEPSLSTNEESSTDSIAGGRPKRTRR